MVHKVERGLFELRQGRALCVNGSEREGSTLVAAVECLGIDRLQQLGGIGAELRLCVTHHRAQAIGLSKPDQSSYLSLAVRQNESIEGIYRLATASDLDVASLNGSLAPRAVSAPEFAALELARFGRLLPALVSLPVHPDSPEIRRLLQDGTILSVSTEEIASVVTGKGIQITQVTEAAVPLADAEHSRFVFFREGGGFLEHVAILIGPREQWPDPVPVRLHSACLTGDLFGSLRCDCGEQLRESLRHFQARGGGVLVYLAQEGRGIGLGNKIRAYTLQEEGLDTVSADGVLGFGADERRYDAAVAILHYLGLDRIQLLTNNPDKVRAVEEGGIRVVRRTPLFGRINRHNLRYVQAKVDRSGHWLREMLAAPVSAD
jgi:GTP cyclohydrolase II